MALAITLSTPETAGLTAWEGTAPTPQGKHSRPRAMASQQPSTQATCWGAQALATHCTPKETGQEGLARAPGAGTKSPLGQNTINAFRTRKVFSFLSKHVVCS